MGLTCFSLVAAFAGPAWYFVHENYSFFTKIAYDTHPVLIDHMDREQTWIVMLLFLGTLSAGLITGLTTLRITTELLGPLYNMEKHMRRLIRGDWSGAKFASREKDELRDITGTYSYLYSTLRAQAESELKLLEKVIVDPREIESMRSWLSLVNLKRKQLGLNEIESSASSVSVPDSRRAS
jgi:hypothetical protein